MSRLRWLTLLIIYLNLMVYCDGKFLFKTDSLWLKLSFFGFNKGQFMDIICKNSKFEDSANCNLIVASASQSQNVVITDPNNQTETIAVNGRK